MTTEERLVCLCCLTLRPQHFVGNQAIDLANGEPRLQIAYSGSFTALSFFVPILVLAAAFMAVGSNNKVSWWRISSGGTLCGGAVCGMHYLGNASIANYACIYHTVNVIGAALIAVAASTVALSLFFIFRSIWANSWWKRIASAVILAAAVSGMHWVAAVGTRYKLVTIEPAQSEVTRRSTVIVVICLVSTTPRRLVSPLSTLANSLSPWLPVSLSLVPPSSRQEISRNMPTGLRRSRSVPPFSTSREESLSIRTV